jgi:leukotriene-A4 hydrolase
VPKEEDVKGWTANQTVVFLEKILLSSALTPSQSQTLGKTYSLVSTQNVELSSRYFQIGLRAQDKKVYPLAADLLGKVGRMKFVRPLYRGLVKVDRQLAVKTFEKNRDFYHPICRGMIQKDLGL